MEKCSNRNFGKRVVFELDGKIALNKMFLKCVKF